MPCGDYFRERLTYDHDTGLLYRKSTGALASLNRQRYVAVSLQHQLYAAHRVIWRMEISEDIPHEIDHIDGNKRNNRLCNLRAANHHQNGRNRGLTKANTSGFKGVTWDRGMKRWKAQITVDWKNKIIGYYDDPKEAHAAYVEAAKVYHGDFANDGWGPISAA